MSETGDLIKMRFPSLFSLILFSALFSFSYLSYAGSTESQSLVEKARSCTGIPERLPRLACFDHLFQTPVHKSVSTGTTVVPFSWQQTMDSYNETREGEKTHLNLQTIGELSNAWLTLGATNGRERYKKGPVPVLKMSCIDRISRIELAMPSEVKEARVRLSLVSGDTRYWRTDDTGLLLTAGRGIPAINQMKKIMQERSITLRSNDSSIDGLTFETDTLRDALKPLRERCDW
ncbi:type VI secretion system-associated protein VasI [Vibrio salinus]|uniref:type VI secretion system-associated protein VasI n=1 Tax=Vibrio salinus TaxID=2899784 RepID=UPI001E34DEF5|nr:type VI secretion system-associated protein VasI [Vibrio salinus]MCE0495094.1 type VI secretion system-associated protein TagO [Vibrio salinus]